MSQYPGSAPGSPYSANSASWSANGYDPALAGGQPPQYQAGGPFQASQTGYPGAAGPSTPSRSLAAPTALAVAGLVILLIAVIGGIGAAVTRSQFNATVTGLPDDQAATVELTKGSTYGLFYSDSDDAPECSITSPDGDDVTTSSSSSSTRVKGAKLFSTFSSSESGSYTVDCDSTSGVSVGEIVAPSSATSTMLSLFGVVGAVIIGIVGIGLGAGGMAWRSKLAAAGAAPAQAAMGQPVPAAPGMADGMTGAAVGTPAVYTQGAWQSGQQYQPGQYAPTYQPESAGQQAPYAPSAAGAAPQYSQVAPTAQFGWTGQPGQYNPPGQPGQQGQPEQPSVFTQPIQPDQYNQPGQPGQQGQQGQPGQYNQPGQPGWPGQ